MPGAKVWLPETPNLYRCRVTVKDSDAKDVLFGCRSFTLCTKRADESPAASPAAVPEGMFLLNGKPVYLRGTNIQGVNAYWYWGQSDELFHALLLLKAGNFNAVRSCQHVEFPEILEWMDRVGMMSEQDQGGGYQGSIDMGIRRQPHIHTGTVLARQTYNNPGVVLLCFGNEHEFPTGPIVRAALAVDPQRIFKPISGRFSHSAKPWDLPVDLRANAIDDGHPYSGWYGNVVPQTWSNLQISRRAAW
ncbi:MAG: glycoside hydrolase family 2 TIM barrel-domain containing protein [Thermoguttaceae bacterium]